jgi:hypothetical protein
MFCIKVMALLQQGVDVRLFESLGVRFVSLTMTIISPIDEYSVSMKKINFFRCYGKEYNFCGPTVLLWRSAEVQLRASASVNMPIFRVLKGTASPV